MKCVLNIQDSQLFSLKLNKHYYFHPLEFVPVARKSVKNLIRFTYT